MSAFSPHHSPRPQTNPLISLASTLPLGFVHVSFIVVPENPSPHCPLPSPLWLLLDCSISLVVFCLLFSFVDYIPVKGEIIWYLSFTAWLISLISLTSQVLERMGRKGNPSALLVGMQTGAATVENLSLIHI